jgi:SAM-dependent methyltransferase
LQAVLDLGRVYRYRFRDVDQGAREAVWAEIAPFIHRALGEPERVLDPAAGTCEFINNVTAAERWAVDMVAHGEAADGVKMLIADATEVELPAEHFDGVFVSNFLEHLADQNAIADFLQRMNAATAPGGRIAILGPNYRYCADEYWDCADHFVALTHVAIEEHLYAAGFEPERVVPRFLPYSFRSRLPASSGLTRAYLGMPVAWRLLGKQFLVIGRK